jgi:SOS response regulatory protein OraA/RecX
MNQNEKTAEQNKRNLPQRAEHQAWQSPRLARRGFYLKGIRNVITNEQNI